MAKKKTSKKASRVTPAPSAPPPASIGGEVETYIFNMKTGGFDVKQPKEVGKNKKVVSNKPAKRKRGTKQ